MLFIPNEKQVNQFKLTAFNPTLSQVEQEYIAKAVVFGLLNDQFIKAYGTIGADTIVKLFGSKRAAQ